MRERLKLGRVLSGNEERDHERAPGAQIVDRSTHVLPPPPKLINRDVIA